MTPGVRPFVAGNWKMNGLSASLGEIEAMRRAADAGEAGEAELAVFPPFTLLAQAAWKLKGGKLALGAQDCSPEPSGAFTGDISAAMLKDAGAAYVIVGHSERRTLHHETDALVRAKAEAALKAGLFRSFASARRQPSAKRASRPLSSFGSCEGRSRPGHERDRRDRLRAGMGDRHRPHADAGRRHRHPQRHPGAARRGRRPARRQDPHSLRRLGQARELPASS